MGIIVCVHHDGSEAQYILTAEMDVDRYQLTGIGRPLLRVFIVPSITLMSTYSS